jgi:ribonuclease HI
MAKYTIHFDGSCWPNPNGKAAYGYTLDREGVEVSAVAGIVGEGTGMSNNVAEFYALYAAFVDQKLQTEAGDKVSVRGDSMLVINILSHKWKASNDKLYWEAYRKAALELNRLEGHGIEVDFSWIPREQNTRCDDLSKEHNHAPK